MKHKNKIRNCIMSVCLVGMAVLFTAVPVLAGDINGNEARVIAVASGTFEYNGETYRAQDSYISQLKAYLSSDDVDLTAEQADKVISEIYGNVAEGVESGYLYKVSGDGEDTTEETTENTETTTEEETEEETEETTEPAAATSDVQATTTETVIEQVDEQDALGTLVYDEEQNAMIYYSPSSGQGIRLPSIEYPGEVARYNRGVFTIQLVFSTVLLLLLLLLLLAKCFPGQKKKRSRAHSKYYVNHKRRKQIRYIVGYVFTVLLALQLGAGFLLVGVRTSLFRNAFVQDHLTSSGYYRYIYDTMMDNLSEELSALPEEAVDTMLEPMTYERFLGVAKSMVQASLEGSESVFSANSLEEKFTEKIAEVDLPEPVSTYIKEAAITNMESYTKDVIGSSIYGIRLSMNDILRGNLLLYFVNMISMMVILVAMDRYRHRGVRYISRACIAGAGLVILLSGGLLVWKPYTRLRMNPEYLFLFIVDYLQRGMVITFVVGIIGIMAGICLYFLMKLLRQRKIAET
ncbi:MAG: hypothetical protein K2G89_00550 [Lachnospiraceae bacterium]|nr:hypothetical protein [Lachnospiraceae bacterium]